MADQQSESGSKSEEMARITKLQEENERLRYRIKILENAIQESNK